MERVQILLEPEQKQILQEIAKQEKQNFSELVRHMLKEQINKHRKQVLTHAAKSLLDDYATDEELRAFSALSGEEFHA